MSKPLSRKYVNEYESDDGLVEDAPKSKKRKGEPKAVSNKMEVDDDGNEFWEISGKRRVQISKFKNTTMVSVREFYEKDGKMLPGKKGISLSVDQYTALIDLLPQIEGVLKSKGHAVPRPHYGNTAEVQEEEDEAEGNGSREVDGQEEEEASKHKGKLDRFKMKKKNHEATSDEDDG